MALLRRSDVFGNDLRESVIKVAAETESASKALLKEAAAPLATKYHVFLSHSYRDSREVRKLQEFLLNFRLQVYVDWMVEDDLSRASVTPETAKRLRARIANSRCLLVYTTKPAQASRWMPWELGIADGMGKRVGIIPVVADNMTTDDYSGNEYLGLYPYIAYSAALQPGVDTWLHQPFRTILTRIYAASDMQIAVPHRTSRHCTAQLCYGSGKLVGTPFEGRTSHGDTCSRSRLVEPSC